jgi:GH25 family lysozyme M1 (1,4-beta-N-acetylmuramidase)
VAEWGVSRPSVPANNWAGRGYSVWQYTSSGSVPGISGRVDLDRLGKRLGKITVH